jgi:hypothetical protein
MTNPEDLSDAALGGLTAVPEDSEFTYVAPPLSIRVGYEGGVIEHVNIDLQLGGMNTIRQEPSPELMTAILTALRGGGQPSGQQMLFLPAGAGIFRSAAESPVEQLPVEDRLASAHMAAAECQRRHAAEIGALEEEMAMQRARARGQQPAGDERDGEEG